MPVLPPSAQIPLRNLQRSELPTNYVDSTDLQVTNIEVAPGASPELSKSAAQIDDALQTVRTGFEQLHKDAYQLVMLAQSDKSQLLSSTALSLLNDMETQADSVYLDVMNIYNEIQNLPTFNISPYKA